MKKQKTGPSLFRTVSNNWFLIRNLNRVAPMYIWPNWAFSVINAIGDFISSIWVLRHILNGVQQGVPFKDLVLSTVPILAVIFLIYTLYGLYFTYIWNFARLDADKALLLQLFRRAAEMDLACWESPAFYDRYMKGMMAILSNSASVSNDISNLLFWGVSLLLNGGFIVAMSPELLVLAVIPAAVSFFVGRRLNALRHRYDMEVAEINRRKDYTRRTFFQVEFAKEMRLTGIAGLMLSRFDCATKDLIACLKKYGFKLATLQFISYYVLEAVGTYGTLIYVAWRVLAVQSMPLGDAFVMINAVSSLSNNLQNIATMLNGFHLRSLYVEEYRTFVGEPRRVTPNPDGPKAEPTAQPLSLRNVTFTYDGQEAPTLKGISLDIRPGEKIALVGHNGAGKSTLAKLLLRLYDPTEGEVRLGDLSAAQYELESYRAHFGVVFQDFKMFSLNVKENVMMRRCTDADDAAVIDALKKSGAWERIERLPNGINTVLSHEFNEEGVVLSGGEAQKVAIARVFARPCGTVILDEPSSALDPIAEYKMYQSMLQACEGKTLVFISHRLASATLADRVVLLEDGCIAEMGTHDELMGKDGLYAQMFRNQAEQYLEQGGDDNGTQE
ncbi:MAG: ABC transporter ATP-binding protein [Clostridia bacterium]|nr:ABC transporter ATP-binding protein [Clostridia bacterium]